MAPRETHGQRLERIEDRVDKLSEAMIHLARAEEKLVAMEKDVDHAYERVNRHSQKLDELERITERQRQTVQIINKLFWLGLATGFAVLTERFFL